jgi:hypothetical protein
MILKYAVESDAMVIEAYKLRLGLEELVKHGMLTHLKKDFML